MRLLKKIFTGSIERKGEECEDSTYFGLAFRQEFRGFEPDGGAGAFSEGFY